MNKKIIILAFLMIITLSGLIVLNIDKEKSKNEVLEKDYIAENNEFNVTKKITEKEIIYEVIDKGLTYSWTFAKNDNTYKLKDNIEIETDLKLDVIKDSINSLNNLVSNKDVTVIKFSHHGELPSKAKILIDVKDKYKEGELLYLYYFNEEENKVEYIDRGIKVENGKVEFEIEHCSKYFLTASIVQDAVNNPKNINIVIIVMVVVIIVLIAVTLFQNKNK